MKKSQIIDVRPADENHQVVTVHSPSRDKSPHMKRPCLQCPWRKDSPVGAFPAEAYRHSARTAYDMASETFACHMAGVENPKTCAGFLLQGSRHNMTVRLLAFQQEIDFGSLNDGGIELYENYKEMAVANGVDPDDEALRPCR